MGEPVVDKRGACHAAQPPQTDGPPILGRFVPQCNQYGTKPEKDLRNFRFEFEIDYRISSMRNPPPIELLLDTV